MRFVASGGVSDPAYSESEVEVAVSKIDASRVYGQRSEAGAAVLPFLPAKAPGRIVVDFGAAETATLTSAFVKANDLARLGQTNATVNRPAGLEKPVLRAEQCSGAHHLQPRGGHES